MDSKTVIINSILERVMCMTYITALQINNNYILYSCMDTAITTICENIIVVVACI